ncbi:MAG: biotin/lipoyl-binding protein, partial [Pseudomonadota bacterium]|nr:biotin/lipoyl-binding protein [Pseudomonadota bacterium]
MAHEQAVMPANDAPPVAAAPPAHVQLTTDAPKNWRPVIAIGFIILLGFFGGFGGWAAYAPLGTGAIAVGQVQVAGKQKMVQSKDGGIIAALHVRDGDVVSTGQVLLELDSTETQVEVSVLSSQLWALQARMARLEAERLNSPVPKFPAELLAESDNPEVVKLIESERRLFDKRRAAMTSQIALL